MNNVNMQATEPVAPTAHIRETYADGFGNWHAVARAAIPAFDFDAPEPDAVRIHRATQAATKAAHAAILDALAEREQKTGETLATARRRIRAYLKREPLTLEKLDVNPHIDAVTVVYGERPARD